MRLYTHKYQTSWVVVLAFTMVAIVSSVQAHEASWPGKRLSKVFPKAGNFKARQVTLTPTQIAQIEADSGSKIGVEDKAPTFYIAYGKDKETGEEGPIGAVVFIDAIGERGDMEVNVAVTLKGELGAVSLWKHKESKSIEGKEFLKQFNKKKKITDPFKVGEDIVAAKGADKASQALAIAAKKGWLMFREVFGKKESDTDDHHEAMMDIHDDDHHEGMAGVHDDHHEDGDHHHEEDEGHEHGHEDDGHEH